MTAVLGMDLLLLIMPDAGVLFDWLVAHNGMVWASALGWKPRSAVVSSSGGAAWSGWCWGGSPVLRCRSR